MYCMAFQMKPDPSAECEKVEDKDDDADNFFSMKIRLLCGTTPKWQRRLRRLMFRPTIKIFCCQTRIWFEIRNSNPAAYVHYADWWFSQLECSVDHVSAMMWCYVKDLPGKVLSELVLTPIGVLYISLAHVSFEVETIPAGSHAHNSDA